MSSASSPQIKELRGPADVDCDFQSIAVTRDTVYVTGNVARTHFTFFSCRLDDVIKVMDDDAKDVKWDRQEVEFELDSPIDADAQVTTTLLSRKMKK